MLKQYYQILGLDSENVDSKTIKQAFIKNLRLYHPDYAATPNEAKMKEVNEAYEVLSDPTRKSQYDAGMYNNNFGQSDNSHSESNDFFQQQWNYTSDPFQEQFQKQQYFDPMQDLISQLFSSMINNNSRAASNSTFFSFEESFETSSHKPQIEDIKHKIKVTFADCCFGRKLNIKYQYNIYQTFDLNFYQTQYETLSFDIIPFKPETTQTLEFKNYGHFYLKLNQRSNLNITLVCSDIPHNINIDKKGNIIHEIKISSIYLDYRVKVTLLNGKQVSVICRDALCPIKSDVIKGFGNKHTYYVKFILHNNKAK